MTERRRTPRPVPRTGVPRPIPKQDPAHHRADNENRLAELVEENKKLNSKINKLEGERAKFKESQRQKLIRSQLEHKTTKDELNTEREERQKVESSIRSQNSPGNERNGQQEKKTGTIKCVDCDSRQKELETCKREIASLKKSQRMLEKKKKGLNDMTYDELDSWTEDQESQSARSDTNSSELRQHREQLKDYKSRLRERNKDIKDMQATLSQERKRHKEQLAQAERERAQLEKKMDTYKTNKCNEIKRLKLENNASFQKQEAELRKLADQNYSQERRITELQQSESSLLIEKEEFENLKMKTSETETNTKAKDENISTLRGKLKQAKAEKIQFEHRLEVLQEENENLNERWSQKLKGLQKENDILKQSEKCLCTQHGKDDKRKHQYETLLEKQKSVQQTKQSLTFEVQKLTQDLEASQAKNRALQQSVQYISSKLEDCMKKKNDLEQSEDSLRERLQRLENQLSENNDWKQQYERLCQNYKLLEETEQELNSKVDNLTEQLTASQEENKSLKQQEIKLRNEAERIESLAAKYDMLDKDWSRKYNKLRQKYNALEETGSDLRAKIKQHDSQDDFQQKYKYLLGEFNSVNDEKERLKKETLVLERRNAEDKNDMEKLNQEITTLQNENRDLNRLKVQICEQKNAIQTLRKERESLTAKYNSLDSEWSQKYDRLHQKYSALEKAESDLRTNIEQHERQNDLQQKYKNLQIEFSALEDEKEMLMKQNTDLESRNAEDKNVLEKLRQESISLRNEHQDFNNKKVQILEQEKKLRRKLEKSFERNTALESELNGSKKSNKLLERQLGESEKACERWMTDCSRLENENKTRDQKIQECERKIQSLESTKDSEIENQKTYNRNSNNKFKSEIEDLRKQKDNANREVERLKKELEKLKKKNKEKADEMTIPPGSEESYTHKIQQLEKEKTDLLDRLSRIAGSRLTEGNPSIVDLSDEKRPTKLAEMFSELYDNEWTDAYDEQHGDFKKSEKKSIEILLGIVQGTHEHCHSVSERYLSNIKNAVTMSPNQDKGNNRPLFKLGLSGDGPAEMNKHLQMIRTMVTPLIKDRIVETLKSCWKKEGFEIGKKTTMYINKCLELCWEMSVKDPPVVLMPSPAVGSPVDKDKFRFYTQSGSRVEYVVWPALLLHSNGPSLSKGVLQAGKEIKK